MKVCEFCGRKFKPNSSSQRYCKGPHIRICPICGKAYEEKNVENLKRPPKACSYACRAKKTRQTSLERYGTAAPGNNAEAREKAKQTMKEKYGVEYTLQSETLKQRCKNTLIEKYGVDNCQKSETVKQKTAETNFLKYGAKTYLTSERGVAETKAALESKYGVDHPMKSSEIRQSVKNTMLDRYGVEYYTQASDFNEKRKQTMKERYGVESPFQYPEFINKAKSKWIRHYGVDNPSKCPEIVQKIHTTFVSRYGTDGVMNIPEIHDRIVKTNMKKYGVPYFVMLPDVAKSSGKISKINYRIASILDNLNISYSMEYPIGSKSFDFLLDKYNILLEIDPSYTHNLVGNHWGSKIDINYHRTKSDLAAQHGYRCIHIFDWDNANQIIKSIVPGKRATISSICVSEPSEEIVKFLTTYKKSVQPNSIYAVLKQGSTIVQVFTINCQGDAYAIADVTTAFRRYPDISIQSVLENILATLNISAIRYSVDLSKFSGEGLVESGLEFIEETAPQLIWSKGTHAISNSFILTQKNISEEAFLMMVDSGYLPVPDCGYRVYEYHGDNQRQFKLMK